MGGRDWALEVAIEKSGLFVFIEGLCDVKG
jgi:hypothetical protein